MAGAAEKARAKEVTKELMVAVLSNSTAANLDTEVGEDMGDMYIALYKKILSVEVE